MIASSSAIVLCILVAISYSLFYQSLTLLMVIIPKHEPQQPRTPNSPVNLSESPDVFFLFSSCDFEAD